LKIPLLLIGVILRFSSVSLSEDVRNELAAIAPERECDRLAELSALFHFAGRLHLLGRGSVSVHVDLASAAVARRAFALLRSFGVSSEIRTYRRRAFGQETRYQLHVEGGLGLLREAGVVDARLAPRERPPKRVLGRGCCRAAYLRGALLASGSVSGPPSAHLEVRSESRAGAETVAEAAELRVGARGDGWVAYAKGIDRIAGALAEAGASDAALILQERAVVGATRASANRLANADTANLERSGRAAHTQLEAVKRLEQSRRLDELSPRLREIAGLRAKHPSLSLRELGAKCDPPVTKATAHRRLKAVLRLAQR
jgi:cell division protein WhiA